MMKVNEINKCFELQVMSKQCAVWINSDFRRYFDDPFKRTACIPYCCDVKNHCKTKKAFKNNKSI